MDVLRRLSDIQGLHQLIDALSQGHEVAVCDAAGSGPAAALAWTMQRRRSHCLVICEGAEEAEEFAEDVNVLSAGLACHFPALEVLPGDMEDPSEPIMRARLATLRHLAFGPATEESEAPSPFSYLEPEPRTRIVVAGIAALLQPTSSVEELRSGSRTVAVGEEVAPGELVSWLVDNGYLTVPQVESPGQYCLRGGILDVYSHGAAEAVRIEFFANKIDSLRSFDPSTQLSTGRVKSAPLTAAEHPSEHEPGERNSLLAYFDPDCLICLADPDRVWERARTFFDRSESPGSLIRPETLAEGLAGRQSLAFLPGEDAEETGAIPLGLKERDVFGPDLDSMLQEVERIAELYHHVVVYCISPAERDRFLGLLKESDFSDTDRLQFVIGRLNHGLLCPEASLALLPHHRLFGRYTQRRFMPYAREGRPIESVQDLAQGDLVVHLNHGIGRFAGTRVLEQDGRRREHLTVEFADNVHVYVPSDRIEMVHRYIGVGGRRPQLSRIRAAGWTRTKQRVNDAVEDLATELLELQAVRESQSGIAHPVDTEWQRQFESEFPYEETEDQLRAIEQVKNDMASQRPMDRLICGDVGYGKTEVAMRAAFAAVVGGKQVAVLVPTTVLAQQHYRTFQERMADYPYRIEMLSRFLTDAQARDVLQGMAEGTVDIVIGTHKLVQPDVRFADLGLLIIDEEQRFGVQHKERLKKLRATVDVLTLTATPIPRTLHMALMGLREISALQTPPRDRQAIKTKVCPFDSELLRHAILREMNREGQVFVIHNRVKTIKKFAQMVAATVPEARVAVAHGQMPEHQLAETMDRFIDGEVDVLVSTTIIESGLDIPNANTIIIDKAEILGLAEMHQLRGRVGRYVHKAYAYLFTPRDRPMTPEAGHRMDAIRRYSHLGAGFDIALRDLEIRGAGNILGPAQSGHIAAIGYNLYCRLLARAAARMRGETLEEPPEVTLNIGMDALVPEEYIPVPKQRMELYRELGTATDVDAVRSAERALRDRFGPPPREVVNLLLEAELRILLDRAGIDSVHLEGDKVHFGVRSEEDLLRWFADRRPAPRVVAPDLAVLDRGFPENDPVALSEHLLRLFRSGARALQLPAAPSGA